MNLIPYSRYLKSPVVNVFFANFGESIRHIDTAFFGIIHVFFMLTSIVVLTIGSALAKRKPIDHEKFKTVLVWFSISLLLISLAIPWPFSPFANRPYFRSF